MLAGVPGIVPLGAAHKFAAILDRFPNANADLTSRPTGPTPEAWTAFLEKYSDRLYIGPDLAMPSNRPPDRPWNRDECYNPWRQRLLSWNLRPATLEKIAWCNGMRDYFPSGFRSPLVTPA